MDCAGGNGPIQDPERTKKETRDETEKNGTARSRRDVNRGKTAKFGLKIAPILESESVRSFAGHGPDQDPERTWSFALSFAAFPRGAVPSCFRVVSVPLWRRGGGGPFLLIQSRVSVYPLWVLSPTVLLQKRTEPGSRIDAVLFASIWNPKGPFA